MDMFDSMFSPACKLNEQAARQIFEILPEDGPIIMIMDRDGNNWPSDSARFSKLNVTASFFDELLNKIDDGEENVSKQNAIKAHKSTISFTHFLINKWPNPVL